MNKKAVALVLALLALMAAAIFGLPLMTRRMEARRMDSAVYVTATPAPEYDEDGYLYSSISINSPVSNANPAENNK